MRKPLSLSCLFGHIMSYSCQMGGIYNEREVLEDLRKRDVLLQTVPEQAPAVYQKFHAGSVQDFKLRTLSQ